MVLAINFPSLVLNNFLDLTPCLNYSLLRIIIIFRRSPWNLSEFGWVPFSMEAHFQKRFEQMLSRLKENRLRVTPQRLAVLKILASSSEHPTVESIYEHVKKEFPTTSLATVYKTVSVLKRMNEVLELGFPDGSNRYDGKRPFPHPHMVCTQCQEILDPDLSSLRELTEEIGKETGYKILFHRLDFFGLCPKCRET